MSGSSLGARPAYATAADDLGAAIASRGWRLVYGGAAVGLMGRVADAALAAGGEVVGVIPRSIADAEVAHHGLSELRVVGSMHERKATMATLSDGAVALPGGFGTLDELAELLTWLQLGLHVSPCGVLDVDGYWDLLLAWCDHSVAEGFVRPEHRALLLRSSDPSQLLDRLEGWEPPPTLRKWT